MSVNVSAKVTYVDHALAQFAGEIGLLSIGLGKNISQKYNIAFMYGIVPAEVSKASAIETITLRQTYDLYNWDILTFYTGLNIYHTLGLKYQTSEYGKTPKNYYPIGSVHALLNLGFKLDVNLREGREYYFETGLNEVWIENYVNNTSVMNPLDKVSMALGVKQFF